MDGQYVNDYCKLEKVPFDLYDIFIPKTYADYIDWKINLNKWLRRSKIRNEVICLQRKYNLSFRPNQSMPDVMVRVRIKCLKNKLENPEAEDECGEKDESI